MCIKQIAGGFCLLWPKSVLLDEWQEYGESSESIIFDRSNWYRQLTIFHKVVRKPTLLLGNIVYQIQRDIYNIYIYIYIYIYI